MQSIATKGQQAQAEFLKEFDRNMKRRRLRLATLGHGSNDDCPHAGLPLLVANETRQGDHVAIIKACSVPVILRSQLIGMGYLEGAMYGGMVEPDQQWSEMKLY
jgi:hypothetical protein